MSTPNTFRSLLEKQKTAIYYVKDELWLAYGQGSGQTIQLPKLSKYLNSDPSDTEHYDSAIDRLIDYASSLKPIKKTSNTKLYEIPRYNLIPQGQFYDIWNGDVKAKSKIYMSITDEKSTIINFFEKKNEALNWVKSISQ
jgi:hypothetical protein